MKRRDLLTIFATTAAVMCLPARAATGLPEVEVFRDPSCGCCGQWVEHLKAAGFAVKLRETSDLAAVRKRVGMPDAYASCHTAVVAGYALEGHVPAAEVKRLLSARPAAVGLAVPGMPASAPGMDVPGRKDPYQVLLVNRQGGTLVFANYPKA